MNKKIISIIIIFFMVTSLSLFSDEVDYIGFFNKVKSSMSPINVTEKNSKFINNKSEYIEIFRSGINSFSVLAPYTQEKNIIEVIEELSNFHFTLRSPKSTEIYDNSINATVLVVAPEVGYGAGFVLDEDKGLIATNYHVTSGLKNLLVSFYDENIQDPSKLKYYSASVVKYSAKRDIAILKLSKIPQGLHGLDLFMGIKPNVGEDVHTIGHPLALTWTYSQGQITSIRNNFKFGEEEIADVIQIDANISPGNSGGPLLNDKGEVIGLVTFVASSEYAQNLNFAISSREINEILKRSKNEETSASKIVNKLYGLSLFSVNDILKSCEAYKVDENGDGKYDYISLLNIETKKEEYRLIKNFEIELDQGEKQLINILLADITEDGEMDVMFVDYDLDNNFDSIMVDINLDGEPDIVGIDSEGKGKITEAWFL